MIRGDLVSGATKISESLKLLLLQWEATTEQWRDAASRRYEEDHLSQLEPKVHLTVDAIARLADVLERAQRECSDGEGRGW